MELSSAGSFFRQALALVCTILAAATASGHEPPEVQNYGRLNYPIGERHAGYGGWVQFIFMVDREGKPYELRLMDYAGSKGFIGAGEKALLRSTFTPALVDGVAVDGRYGMIYHFGRRGGGTGAGASRRSFVPLYTAYLQALNEGPGEKAASLLEELADASRNNYEHAFLNVARYYFAREYGSSLEQMRFLSRALRQSFTERNHRSFLPDDQAISVRRELFRLQVENNYLGEAMETYELIQQQGDDESMELLEGVVAELEEMKRNEASFGIAVTLDDSGSWGAELFKNQLYLHTVEGKVDGMKLRCDTNFFSFTFDPETDYSIPEEWGKCHLEILGAPRTTFVLVQH